MSLKSIGEMRHRINIYNPDTVDDQAAGPVAAGALLRQVWAAIEPMSGREQAFMAQRQLQATHRITIRYAADITPYMKIMFDVRVFKIVGMVNLDEKNQFLEITAREVQ